MELERSSGPAWWILGFQGLRVWRSEGLPSLADPGRGPKAWEAGKA